MVKSTEIVSLVLVGAFWGCTNPLLRKGSVGVHEKTTTDASNQSSQNQSTLSSIKTSLSKFKRIRVWLPYALNQFGSVLFYWVLSSSDLSMAVSVCNALSLVFSILTSYALGERVDQPIRACIGSALVMIGVAICVSSQDVAASATTIEEQVDIPSGREEL